MLLRSPGPISPDTYSGHIRRRALCPNRLRNGMSQRSSSSCQSDILPTMVGPSKSRPPMSHRKTDLGIPCRSKSAKVVLGAGSISTYLGRAMPDAQIDVVELDPGVIAAGKKYFGLRETDKVRFIESDGRVYLNRHKDTYDLILLDAFRELGVPFHMLTREFYALV